MTALAADALAILKDHTSASRVLLFPELIAGLTALQYDCAGTRAIVNDARPHVVFWNGISDEFADAVVGLAARHQIFMRGGSALLQIALQHPAILTLPLITPRRLDAGTVCWYPVGLSIHPGELSGR